MTRYRAYQLDEAAGKRVVARVKTGAAEGLREHLESCRNQGRSERVVAVLPRIGQ